MSRESRRGANTAAPPINNPGIRAASTIAAAATTVPRVATVPTIPGPKTEVGCHPPACMKDIVKDSVIEVAVARYKRRESAAVK
jgi:hypothetical protein